MEKIEYVAGDKIAGHINRLKVPGGWLVTIEKDRKAVGITFYPDPLYLWNIK